MNGLVTQLAKIASVQSAELQSTMAAARSRIGAVDSLQLDSTFRSMHRATESLARVTARLETTTDRVNRLLAKADSGGTVGRLLSDPAVYDSVRLLVGSMRGLLEDMQKNPRKYINLRIF
jgi:phospholipid/cholesterol/gamma-HCH transport system substrate-binding protein